MKQNNLQEKLVLKQILGESKVIKEIHKKIRCIAACDATVLISGESGTGKEPAARGIHYLSARSAKPFVPVNCGAIPGNLFENELFGHVKGAFTDAGHHQSGLVKEAEGGTLFLDEIGVIAPYIQVKLLRLLQDREYKPLGDSRYRSGDIRIAAATNEDLLKMVEKGDFREDLYYRLNIVSFHIAPLRERKEDIPILVRHFLKMYSGQYQKNIQTVSTGAMEQLISYAWPGNIRELENKIQQAIVLSSGGVITERDLQLSQQPAKIGSDGLEDFKQAKKQMVCTFEKNYLVMLLTRFNGDMVTAAARAGKSRTALWNLLAKYQLNPKHFSV
ncbi:MAG: sigma-54-dependent Fis family transcriptional regulator [bacterium]|nr:sigma-54-dependent Fis family transcriptional regulator [bacterium]